MAGNIKGITIEFAGDTSKLDKSLREIQKNTKAIDKELKLVDKALKFNPTSVELWRQKQDLLKKKIDETGQRLELLKQKQAQMDASGVDKNSEEYRRLQREIITTENQVKTFEAQLKKIGQVNLRAASEQFKVMGDKLTAAGNAMRGVSMAGAAVVATLGTMSVKAGKAADDINTMSKIYGISTRDLQKYKLAAEQVDVPLETIAKSHVRLEKQMLSAKKGTGTAADAFKALGVEVTNADGSLKEGDAVWQQTIAALGKMENETERDAYAMQLMGKSAAELNPLIEDGGETYQRMAELFEKYNLELVDQETLDRAHEFNDRLDDMRSMGTLAFSMLGAELAGYLLPVMEKAVDVIGRIVSWLASLDPAVLAVIGAIAAVLAVVAPLLLALGQISFAISSILGLMSTLGISFAAIAGPVGIVIAVIAALIAIGVLLYKNWDVIKAKASELLSVITERFEAIRISIQTKVNAIKAFLTAAGNGIKAGAAIAFAAIKNSITSPFTTAVSIIRAAINKIKSIISGAHFTFPHIKLPHFKISGKLSVNPPSVPKISVDWYKTGGIFDSPSIIGVGEAGSEAVVPLDKLWNKLDTIAQAAQSSDGITINVYSTRSDPRAVAEEVRRILIQETNRRRLAWQ